MNGPSLLGELILLLIAVGCIACLWRRAVRRPAPVPDEPLDDPDVIAHDFHEESQL